MMRWKQILWLCTVSVITTKCASVIEPQNVIIQHYADAFNELRNNTSQEINYISTEKSTNSDLTINLNISTPNHHNDEMYLKEAVTTDIPTTIEATTSFNNLEVLNVIPSEQPEVTNKVGYQSRWISTNPIRVAAENQIGDVTEQGGDDMVEGGGRDEITHVIGGGNALGVQEENGRIDNEGDDGESNGGENGESNGVEGGGDNGGEGGGDNGGEGGGDNGGEGGGDNGGEGGGDNGGEGGGDNGGEGGGDNGGEGGGDNGGEGGGDNGGEGGGDNGGEGGGGNGGETGGGNGGEDGEVDGGENGVEGGQGSGGSGGGEEINGVGSGSGDGGENGNVEECIEHCVNTTSGFVRGYKWRNKENIIAYIDLPYGVIENLFKGPTRAKYSETFHSEQEHKKLCPQMKNEEFRGELDCLTLSIFVPTVTEASSVLFHIHDPVIGSADPIVYDPENIVSKGIILVLPNYRIGAPGFLCLLNSTAPGNAGLKDLALALEWVYDNIQSFGGNSSNIVVSGDGIAGAYVGYLTLSPLSQHYVNRAITESGSALSPNALDRNPLYTAERLFNVLTEQENSKRELKDTFEEVPLKNIVEAADGIKFKPCVELTSDEEPFMNNTPWRVLINNKINMEFMIGSASFAGTYEALTLTKDTINSLNNDFSLIFPNDLHISSTTDRQRNGETIKLQYFGENNVTADDLQSLSLCFTDTLYLGPGIRMARSLVASGATVYLYEFDFVGSLSQELERTSRPVPGAVRNDIVRYVFKQADIPVEEDSPEQEMVDLMCNLWISFINEGVPRAPGVNWTEFEDAPEENEAWLHIASHPNATTGVHVKRLSLWTQLYQNYYIERSLSNTITPRDYVTYYTITMLLISFSKFNY